MVKKGDLDLIIDLSYIGQGNMKMGEVVSTSYYSNSEAKYNYRLQGAISLSDLRANYEKNGKSVKETYKQFVEYVRENKDNPEVLNNISNVVLGRLALQYDENGDRNVQIANTPEEFLEKILNTEESAVIKDMTCGDITNFLRDAFVDAGIDAFTIVGAQNKALKDFTNHTFLLFKNSDGTYTFNNYGQSARIKADDIKDAIYTMHKKTGAFETGGQLSIQGKTSSYQEFGLAESSAYGHEMDKRDYNQLNPFDNDVENKSKIHVYLAKMHGKNFLNSKYGTDVVLASETPKKLKNFNFGFERQRQGENEEFLDSKSIGLKFGYNERKHINKKTDLISGVKAIYSHTQGEVGGASYESPLGYKGKIQNLETSYESVMLRGSVNFNTKLLNKGGNELENSVGASVMARGTIGHSTHLSSSYDGRIVIEDGIKYSKQSGSNNIATYLSAGTVMDLHQDVNNLSPTFGGKFNIGLKYNGKIGPNTNIFAGADSYVVHTKSSTDYGVSVNTGLNYMIPNNKKVKKIFVNGSYSLDNQNLHIDNYSEKSENDSKIFVNAGVDFGKTRVSLNYDQYLNEKVNKRNVMATIGVNL